MNVSWQSCTVTTKLGCWGKRHLASLTIDCGELNTEIKDGENNPHLLSPYRLRVLVMEQETIMQRPQF